MYREDIKLGETNNSLLVYTDNRVLMAENEEPLKNQSEKNDRSYKTHMIRDKYRKTDLPQKCNILNQYFL